MPDDYLKFAIYCFTTFITIINPLSIMPVYLTMTSGLTPQAARSTAIRAVITAFITMITFAFIGEALFSFFQITTNGLKVAGGIIFLLMGMDMLQARLPKIRVKKKEVKAYVTDISITPLGIPMICGPGAITNSIILMDNAEGWTQISILLATMLVICLITLIVLISSRRILRVIGETGNTVMMRIMGLIVMVVAVELFFAGLKPILQDIWKIQ
ncbi:MAG: MarC family protein [Flavobacteriales bacterium]